MVRRSEKRRYIRLNSVFPVSFMLKDDGKELSGWTQGFTSDISKNGIRLRAYDLSESLISGINSATSLVDIKIMIPMLKKTIRATARPIWVKPEKDEENHCFIGLEYKNIDRKDNKRLVNFAWTRYLLPRISILLIMLLGTGFVSTAYINFKLVEKNKNVITQLFDVLEQSKVSKQDFNELSQEKQLLSERLSQISDQLDSAKAAKDSTTFQKPASADKHLHDLIETLKKEKEKLSNEKQEMLSEEKKLRKRLNYSEKMKAHLLDINYENMYEWLHKNSDPDTGLVTSYKGNLNTMQPAFTYDQALLISLFSYFKDFTEAKKILTFFRDSAERSSGAFKNAYYASGGAPAEHTVHTGPNIWLGIGAIQYSYHSKDMSFIPLAEEIAEFVLKLQASDGGIAGGPGLNWYSTEHNLDAYAFFRMLANITGNKEHAATADRILLWLKNNSYHHPKYPVARGKNDLMVATDVYAWSISAVLPERLKELGRDPDNIMKYALERCEVSTSFRRPGGKAIEVTGFDFTAKKYLKRDPVVSCEWTAQMILSLKIMSRYFKDDPEQKEYYSSLADFYLWQLSKLIVSSPSNSYGQGRGCLPYASQAAVDTTHGWKTPLGFYTGSVSASAYALMAYHGFNPFELSDDTY